MKSSRNIKATKIYVEQRAADNYDSRGKRFCIPLFNRLQKEGGLGLSIFLSNLIRFRKINYLCNLILIIIILIIEKTYPN